MKQAKILRWAFAVFAAVTVMAAFQYALEQESAEELYQAALFAKNVDGDLRGAIELLQKIIKEYPEDRKICAQAHLQLGMCYEKLGMEQARNSYQQVIDGYPEQTDAVKTAQGKLSKLRAVEKAADIADQGFQIRLVGRGLDSLGEISPDNKYLCCIDWETSNLAVRDMASGEMLRLTSHERSESDSPDVYEAPHDSIWAPDQKRIAYTWYGSGPVFCELRMIGIEDKRPHILVIQHTTEGTQ